MTSEERKETIVVVGKKATTNYTMAVLWKIQKDGFEIVVLRARGDLIGKAVSAARQVVKLLPGTSTGEIKIGDDMKDSNIAVSFIEIPIISAGGEQVL
jgi:DNA-binding protein Alba